MDRNRERKKRLTKYCFQFIKTVDPVALLCHFPKMGKSIKEQIRCRAKQDGYERAAEELHGLIPKADSDWYDYLMEALIVNEYTELWKLLQDDDDDIAVDNQHPWSGNRATSYSSSTNKVEQTVSSPHQERGAFGGDSSATSVAACRPHLNDQSQLKGIQYAHHQTESPQSPCLEPGAQPSQLGTASNEPRKWQGHYQTPLNPNPDTQYIQHRTPSSPEPNTRYDQLRTPSSKTTHTQLGREQEHYGHQLSRRTESNEENADPSYLEAFDEISVSDLTLGQAQQGVRDAFNKKMNDKTYPKNNWMSLAAELGMSVDEVDNIQDAPQLYEKLKTSRMKLVELVQLLQDMERMDLISDIRQFHDLSEIIERPSAHVSRQLSKKDEVEVNVIQINTNLPIAKIHEIHVPKEVKDVVNEHFKSGDVKNTVKKEAVEQNLKQFNMDLPYESHRIHPMKKIKDVNEHCNADAKKIVEPSRSSSAVQRRGFSVASCGDMMPFQGTSAPVTLRVENQPPCISHVEQSAEFIPASVLVARERSFQENEEEQLEPVVSLQNAGSGSDEFSVDLLRYAPAQGVQLAQETFNGNDENERDERREVDLSQNVELGSDELSVDHLRYAPAQGVQLAQETLRNDENERDEVRRVDLVQNAGLRHDESSVDPPRYLAAQSNEININDRTSGVSKSTVVAVAFAGVIVGALASRNF